MSKRREITIDSDDGISEPAFKKSKNILNKSTLSSYGFGDEPNVVVASMDHVRFKPGEIPRFKERVFTSRRKVYTAKHKDLPTVTFLGKDEGDSIYDYALVKYNRTKKEVMTIQPACILKFEGRTEIDQKELTGENIKNKTNYELDFSIKKEEFVEKKKDVVADFGTIRKNKVINAMERRKVNEDTLETLEGSLANTKNIISKQNGHEIFESVESEVMPRPNRDATNPADIYSKTLFYTLQDVTFYGEECINFFKENNSVAKLAMKDVHKNVALIALGILEKPDDPKEAIVRMKFLIYAQITKFIARSPRVLRCEEILAGFPAPIVHECLKENFKNNVDAKKKIHYSNVEKERLYIWFLCMWLLLNDLIVPIGVLTSAVGLPETVSAKYLRGLGCQIEDAKQGDILKYHSISIARLVNQPAASLGAARKKGKKKK